MEGRGLLAEYDADADLLTVWDSTQHPHEIREHIAHLMERPLDSVRVVCPDVGGGYGEKGCFFPEELAIPHLAMTLGRPIKWVESRQENMLCFHGRGHSIDLEAAATSDGKLLGIRVQVIADLGAYFFMSTPTVPSHLSHSNSLLLSVSLIAVYTVYWICCLSTERAVDLVRAGAMASIRPRCVANFMPRATLMSIRRHCLRFGRIRGSLPHRSLEMSDYHSGGGVPGSEATEGDRSIASASRRWQGSGAKVTFLEEHSRVPSATDGDVRPTRVFRLTDRAPRPPSPRSLLTSWALRPATCGSGTATQPCFRTVVAPRPAGA